MPENAPEGRVRRFTDMLGLTEAGKPTPKTSSRYFARVGVVYLVGGLVCLVLALVSYAANQSNYLVFIPTLIFLGLGVGGLVGWWRTHKRNSD